jgi:hypothetical protein
MTLGLKVWWLPLVLGALLGAAPPAAPWHAAAPSIETLVAPGYRPLKLATGDLAGQGREDAAVVIGKASESEQDHAPRWLLIARRDPDGLLRPWAANAQLVWCKSCGEGPDEPLAGLTIHGRVLAVTQHGGMNWRWETREEFMFKAGQWLETSASNIATMVLDTSFSHARVANLQSGLVRVTRRGTEIHGFQAYHELRAALSDVGDGPPLRLASAEDVVVGRPSWRGPSDLAATFQARVSHGTLSIKADITDDIVGAGDTLRLLDRQNRTIKPQKLAKRLRAGGYSVEARYALKDLTLGEPAIAQTEHSPVNGEPKPLPVFEASLEVVDDDGPSRLLKVLSSSQGGRRYPGSIRLQATVGPPRLIDFTHAANLGDDRIDEIAH